MSDFFVEKYPQSGRESLLKHYKRISRFGNRLEGPVIFLRPDGSKIPSGGKMMSTDDLSASGGAILSSGAFLAMAWPPAYLACLKSPGPEWDFRKHDAAFEISELAIESLTAPC